jgi:RHS repeat-associated protein
MTYDQLGRKLTMDDPDMGVWSYGYDGSGNLIRQTDAANQRLCFYYDTAGRLEAKRLQGSGNGLCPGNSGGVVLATYAYHTTGEGKGLLKTVSGGFGVGSYTDTLNYDYRGRVDDYKRVIDGRTYQRFTVYDPLDRPLTMTYPGGESVATGYDRAFPNTLSAGSQQLVAGLDFNVRGQLTLVNRTNSSVPDTTLIYYAQGNNYWLADLLHGSANDALPDFLYDDYDQLGNVETLRTRRFAAIETQTFEYDTVGRLTRAQATNGPADYHYTYTYGQGGNLATRHNVGNGQTRTYTYGSGANHHAHALTAISGGITASFEYDNNQPGNGNMTKRTVNGVVYNQTFDAENRLTSVQIPGQGLTIFHYDATGQRIATVLPNGTKVYTPFPEYEESVPTSGATTKRSSYFLAGQLIAVRVVTGASNHLYFAYADHLGSITALTDSSGVLVNGSLARYEPFGGFRTVPTTNPTITDRGFTSHRHNNTGTPDLGLIYMNARYYLPEIGRFISADTIVPDPQNPQSFNR